YGWLVKDGETLSFNHWWSEGWDGSVNTPSGQEQRIEVRGALYSHRAAVSGPCKHFVLRVLSFTLGPRIIGWLKARLIFKDAPGSIRFQRSLFIRSNEIVVEDTFEGLPAGCEPRRAARASKRHVSSADSFHVEDLSLCRGVERSEERRREGDRLTIQTRYSPAPDCPVS
nr:hypothetical protein [Akkermansiaceae bacterium]